MMMMMMMMMIFDDDDLGEYVPTVYAYCDRLF